MKKRLLSLLLVLGLMMTQMSSVNLVAYAEDVEETTSETGEAAPAETPAVKQDGAAEQTPAVTQEPAQEPAAKQEPAVEQEPAAEKDSGQTPSGTKKSAPANKAGGDGAKGGTRGDSSVIDSATFTVTAPVEGGTTGTQPTVDVPSDANYYVDSADWVADGSGTPLSGTVTFEKGQRYYIKLRLKPNSDYLFDDDAFNLTPSGCSFAAAPDASTEFIDAVVSVAAAEAPAPPAIDSASITVGELVEDQQIDSTKRSYTVDPPVSVPSDAAYSIQSAQWVRDAQGTLYQYSVYVWPNQTYYFKINLKADDGRKFDSNATIAVDGGSLVSSTVSDSNIEAIISLVSVPKPATPISAISLTVTPPAAGTTAYNASHSGDGVVTLNSPSGYGWPQEASSGAISWDGPDGRSMDNSAKFEKGKTYTAYIQLRSDEDRLFTDDTQVTVNGATLIYTSVGHLQSWTTMGVKVQVTIPGGYDIHLDPNAENGDVWPLNKNAEGYYKWENYAEGETVNLSVQGDWGYLIDSVTVTNDTTGAVITLDNLSFDMPASDVTISWVAKETGQNFLSTGCALKDGTNTTEGGTCSWTATDNWGK